MPVSESVRTLPACRRDRLTSRQIVLLRSLAVRGGSTCAITIHKWQRGCALPLWRRGIVEIWYRQSPDADASLQGPFYGLTISGAQLASNFIHDKYPAPRGLPGAGEQ